MGIVILVFLAAVAAVIIFAISRNKSKSNVSWVQFYAKGSEAGFSNANIRLLKKLAEYSGIKHPTALFWSMDQMDACIKNFISGMKQQKTEFSSENQEFLAKLYDCRKKMEMNRPIYRNGITSSRNIESLQAVQIVESDAGVFKSKVIGNVTAFICIARPDSSALPPDFSWKYKKIILYFWRKNDAAYCMETRVIDDMLNNDPPILKISHSDQLVRTQNRKSPRTKTHIAARLYNSGNSDVPAKPTVMPGTKCHLVNISDSGCCVAIDGKVSAGMRVIVQFVIDEMPLTINGVVRGVNYEEENNTSFLHIEADIIPINAKNKIFSVLFSIYDEGANDELHKNNDSKMPEVQGKPSVRGMATKTSAGIFENPAANSPGYNSRDDKTERPKQT
jgi:hypothetical protein